MERLRSVTLPENVEVAPSRTIAAGLSGRGIVAAVLRQELRQLTTTFRFRASAFLIVFLMLLAALTAAARYRTEGEEQDALMNDHARELAGATVDRTVEILQPAVKPPWRLSLVVDGGQSATPDVYSQALSALVTPQLFHLHRGNERLPASQPLDWTFVIRVVLSLTAFLLGYDAVCGERRTGTLKLVFSYPVARWKIFSGKLLAIWSCLALPFLGGAVLSLIATGSGGIPFQSADLVKAGLVGLLGLWALLFSVLTALLVSSLSRDSSTSLSVLAWLWVTAVIVVPAIGGLLAHRVHASPTEGETAGDMALIEQWIAREHAGRERRWRPLEWAASDGFAWERASAEAETRRFTQKEEVRRRVVQRKLGQAVLARTLGSLSPASLIEELAARLAGTGLERDASFLEQARAFRPVLAGWLRALDAGDPESPHILFFSGYVSRRPLSAPVPRFHFHEPSVSQGLAAAWPGLALFTCETLALAVVALFAFSRSDAG